MIAPLAKSEMGLEGSFLPATLRRVAGKNEEIYWGRYPG